MKVLIPVIEGILAAYGYGAVRTYKDARRIFTWHRSLTSSLYDIVSVTVSPALPPDKWYVDIQYQLYSKYVADQFRAQGFTLDGTSYAKGEGEQVLQFLPARLRWDEDSSLDFPLLKVDDRDLHAFAQELDHIYSDYVVPVSSLFTGPGAVASFQLDAESYFTKRERKPSPRYKVIHPYVSTALLFAEDGQSSRALDVVHVGITTLSNAQPLPLNLRIDLERLEVLRDVL